MTFAAINLNGPGHYLHWSVFTISVANLVVVLIMLAIFLVALLAPFPRSEIQEATVETVPVSPSDSVEGRRSWTGWLRSAGLRILPPERLLPDRQPSYVASWIYVFGVGSLGALVLAIVSGFLIALGGVDWWHTNAAGHFFNSMHLWSVELFFAFMVIHLWGKFFMAAWRGGRARTWITGMLAFLASIVEAFTGYLSQQNFDSQWIATNGKDALNAAGVGGFFNLMNFGQMLLWHVVLMPLILVAVVAVHVLLVRYRGVVHPFPARRGRDASGRPVAGPVTRPTGGQLKAADRAPWRGPTRRYDIVREAVAAMAVVTAATFALAGSLSSPDVAPITIQKWAQADPADFVGTAATELAGTSLTATYGPPYNDGSAAVQRLGISWQQLAGVLDRIDPATAFVIQPLTATAPPSSPEANALASWQAAPPAVRDGWATHYAKASSKVTINAAGAPVVPPGDYGPVPAIMAAELRLARSGGLDASLVAQHPFYGTNFTKPLLFLEDGGYYAAQAQAMHLQGDQWGVMNETGSYPGQPWLWLYQLWYHLPGFDHSANVDLIAIYLTGLATLLLVLIPFIPKLRDIPRVVPVHRLIWANYYKEAEGRPAEPVSPGPDLTEPTRMGRAQ
ncbi:MAG TPA: cytochrome b N-terminal domain-containing protein [Acidimicrobiales bacterium]|nr:cytochrome b N-terminal domain-containing protein [Acidimicrobiales bacterium]